MKKTVYVPKLSPQNQSMLVVSLEVQPGAPIEAGDLLYEVETDKVVTGIEATETGTLSAWCIQEGDSVHAGDAAAVLEVSE